MNKPMPPAEVLQRVREGVVIPAHPLALDDRRRLDERRQRALTRYYCAAGAGGIAVGVHTTQFEIRDPRHGLLEPVLSLTAEEVDRYSRIHGVTLIKIAGIVGETSQALKEAQFASHLGYHFGLVSLGGLEHYRIPQILQHLQDIAEIIPIFGFYLQPAVGGRVLPYEFWRNAVEIENLLAIKIAPFNRYATLDVARAVWDSKREHEIALYTGNDDHILYDLLSEFSFTKGSSRQPLRIVGGVLGHWAFWTRRAVELLNEVHRIRATGESVPPHLFSLATQITDANAAIFDARNGFSGCIPGILEILRRQGLLQNRFTLNPGVDLSPGQLTEIQRVCTAYPHLRDDEFVTAHLQEWLC